MNRPRIAVAMAAIFALMFVAMPTHGQALQGNTTQVSMSATVNESVSVTASPSSITFDSSGNATNLVTTTLTWNLAPSRAVVAELPYFSNCTALVSGANSIPCGSVMLSVNGNTATPCNQTQGLGQTSEYNACQFVYIVNPPTSYQSSVTNTLQFSIANITSFPAGTYTGVINIYCLAW